MQINRYTFDGYHVVHALLRMAQDYDDLNYMTRKLIGEYKDWGLEVNTGKTEYLCIEGQLQNLTLDNTTILKHCYEYKYLDIRITEDGKFDRAIRERNTAGRRAIQLLNGILWDKFINKTNKKRI